MTRFFRALEQAGWDRTSSEQPESGAPPAGLEPRGEAAAPEDFDGVEERLVSLLTPTSFAAEQYRALRHLIEQLHKSAELSVIAISSPAVGDGKTTTAINLAGALAQAPEARVLLVDADLRRESMLKQLGLVHPDGPGLVDAILNPALPLEGVAQPCPPFNLSVVPTGRRPAAQYELLKSPRLGELLGEARRRYDYVLLDTPPLVPIPDSRVIGKWIDGFLVVVAAHRTPRKLLEEALNVIEPSKIVGLVFNGDDRPLVGYSYGDYYPPPNGNGNGLRRWGRAVTRAALAD